jgi:hypothetical protein
MMVAAVAWAQLELTKTRAIELLKRNPNYKEWPKV